MSSKRHAPEYTIEVHDHALGVRGFLVIDDLTLGVGKGGMRMTPNITLDEVARLARAMTLKNALAGIPFGGAKAGIVWKGGPDSLKKKFVQRFAKIIEPFTPQLYITAPDINVGEKEMQWFVEATGDLRTATGKPIKLGGIPHEFGSTGFGVAQATKVATQHAKLNLAKAKIAIEGFGNVGSFAFKYLNEMGARIVAVADSRGATYDPSGIDFKKLYKTKRESGTVNAYANSTALTRDKFFALPLDILILAATTDVINEQNKKSVHAKIIVEGANIPMKESIEEWFHQHGVLVIPDIIANTGGVISSYIEHLGQNPQKVFPLIKQKITATTKHVLIESGRTHSNPRTVALVIAQRVIDRARYHR